MANHRLDSIIDFVKHKFNVLVTCAACKRTSTMSARGLLQRLCKTRQQDDVRLVEAKMRCIWCERKCAQISPSFREMD